MNFRYVEIVTHIQKSMDITNILQTIKNLLFTNIFLSKFDCVVSVWNSIPLEVQKIDLTKDSMNLCYSSWSFYLLNNIYWLWCWWGPIGGWSSSVLMPLLYITFSSGRAKDISSTVKCVWFFPLIITSSSSSANQIMNFQPSLRPLLILGSNVYSTKSLFMNMMTLSSNIRSYFSVISNSSIITLCCVMSGCDQRMNFTYWNPCMVSGSTRSTFAPYVAHKMVCKPFHQPISNTSFTSCLLSISLSRSKSSMCMYMKI